MAMSERPADWTAPAVTGSDHPRTGTERDLLLGWLASHRAALLWKCSGLTAEQLRAPVLAPSTLTLLGLVRHLAECERAWFTHAVGRAPDVPLYGTDDDPDADLHLTGADAERDLATFVAELAVSDRVLAGADLDAEVVNRHGRSMSVRWIVLHMIEEYARHNGHADLLRERIDGATGDFPWFAAGS
jgi:hypothetical protein